VIAGCQQHGVSRLVYSSSPSVTFDGCDQEGVDESAPYAERWLCHYPHSKALAEQAVLQADDETGLRTCALRPHLIWGPRDQHLIPRLLKRAAQGRLRQVGDGKNLIDMIYVENAAHAHLLAIDALEGQAPAAGQAYFISQGEPVNCWDWINEILALAGLPPVQRKLSRTFAWSVGSLMEIAYCLARLQSEPAMTRFLAAQLSTSHYFDMAQARLDLGYEAQISTTEGMARLQQFFAAEGSAKIAP
jgi:nucleoside-diphosphate-sugar epimerase